MLFAYMAIGISENDGERTYRSRLYKRYSTEQMSVDVASLRASLAAGMPYYRELIRRHIPQDKTTSILDWVVALSYLAFFWGRRNLTEVERNFLRLRPLRVIREGLRVEHFSVRRDHVRRGNGKFPTVVAVGQR